MNNNDEHHNDEEISASGNVKCIFGIRISLSC